MFATERRKSQKAVTKDGQAIYNPLWVAILGARGGCHAQLSKLAGCNVSSSRFCRRVPRSILYGMASERDKYRKECRFTESRVQQGAQSGTVGIIRGGYQLLRRFHRQYLRPSFVVPPECVVPRKGVGQSNIWDRQPLQSVGQSDGVSQIRAWRTNGAPKSCISESDRCRP